MNKNKGLVVIIADNWKKSHQVFYFLFFDNWESHLLVHNYLDDQYDFSACVCVQHRYWREVTEVSELNLLVMLWVRVK